MISRIFFGAPWPKLAFGVGVLLAAISLAAPASAGQRKYCYKTSTVPATAITHFDRVQTRCDVIWTDANVVIDEPLLTNGGDVVIFAESVQINAPIDTRPYFSTSLIFHPPVQGNENGVVNWSSSAGRETIPAHTALFYWREHYDPERELLTFGVSDGHYDGWSDDRLAKPYEASQFPSARPPMICQGNHFSKVGCNGTDAPMPAPESRRSGSVLIVTNQLNFCEKCSVEIADKPLPPETADQGDVERRRFIVTAGVKGGLGSPGTQIICAQGGCFNSDKTNISGRHGDGGDAGDVSIVTYGQDGSDDTPLWSRITDSSGGRPPFLGRLHTRSFAALKAQPNRGSGAFQRLPPDVSPPVEGLSSTPSFSTRVSAEEAVAAVQTRVAALALSRRFAPDILQKEITTSTSGYEEVVLPTDILPRQLLDFRRAVYDGLLSTVAVEMGGLPGNVGGLPHERFTRALSCDKALPYLAQGAIGRELSAFCALKTVYPSARKATAFLEATGGLLNPSPTMFNAARYDSASIAQRVQDLNNVLAKISITTQQIQAGIEEQRVKEDLVLLRERVVAAQKRIEDLLALGNRVDNPLGAFAPLLRTFANQILPVLGGAVADMIAAENAAPGSTRMALSEKGRAKGEAALQQLVSGALPLARRLLQDTDDAPTEGELFNARKALLEALYEVAILQHQAEVRRQDRLAQLNATVGDLLKARAVLTQDYANSVSSFEPLVKYSIAGSMSQPANATAFLHSRSADVRSYLQGLGRNSLPPGFSSPSEGCGTAEGQLVKLTSEKVYKAPECARLRNDSPTTLVVAMESPVFGFIPALVLEPGALSTVSFRGLQLRRDGAKVLLSVHQRQAIATAN